MWSMWLAILSLHYLTINYNKTGKQMKYHQVYQKLAF